ncbi:MAG: F0F1 ATP synthase subunit epsilon [bacterium]|nr:F0F1 ATP synthase subunit epsilon [bacterium]
MSNKKLKFEITTPERVVYSYEIDEVIIPTMMGEIGVLPNHIPLVAILKAGELRVKKNGEEESIAVSGGFIEVRPDKVIILADTAEKSDEIDEQKAEEARRKAEELIKEKRTDATDFAALSAKIEKELVRLRVVRKRRRNKPQVNL